MVPIHDQCNVNNKPYEWKMWAQLKHANRLVAKHAGFIRVSRKNIPRAREMAQASAAKPDDLSSISGTHSVEGENQLPQDFHTCAMVCIPIHTHTKINQSKRRGWSESYAPPFWDRVSLCNLGWPGIHKTKLALNSRDPSASKSPSARIKGMYPQPDLITV